MGGAVHAVLGRLASSRTLRTRAGIGLSATMCLTLAAMLVPGMPTGPAIVAYMLTLMLVLPFLRRQHVIFLVICVALGTALVLRGQWPELWRALWQSVGLASLIVSLILLRTTAQQSEALSRIARDVANLPRGARDLGLSFSSQFIGILLNVGLFGMLAPMIAQSGASRLEKVRMSLAILRGFGPAMLWAPTLAAQVVITTVVPGVTWAGLAPMTFTMAMAMIILGWLFSLLERRFHPGDPPRPSETHFSGHALAEVGALIAVMVVIILGLHVLAGLGLLAAVMVASLALFVIWTTRQARGGPMSPGAVLLSNTQHCIGTRLAAGAHEVLTLGAAGFMAAAITPLIPPAWLDAAMLPLSQYRLVLYPSVAVAIAGFSAIGLNPLVAASLIGGAFSAIPPDLLEPHLLAFSLASGWGVAFGVSPFTTGTVVLASVLQISSRRLAWSWNGACSIFLLTFVVLVLMTATLLTAP